METDLHGQPELPYPIVEAVPIRRESKINAVLGNRQDLIVVLEGLFNPNNIGAIMRTCDSFGVGEIFYIGQKIPNLKSRVAVSSTGAENWVTASKFNNIADCYKALRELGYKICTTYDGPDSLPINKADFTKPTAIVFGHEHNGVSEAAFKAADFNVRIPMLGFVKCMNVSVACGVILYEAIRQRTTV